MERFPAGNEEMYGCTEKTICLKIHAVPLQKSVYLYVIYCFFLFVCFFAHSMKIQCHT